MTVKVKKNEPSAKIRPNAGVIPGPIRRKAPVQADTSSSSAQEHGEARAQTVLTILTGSRPALLWQTLKALTANAPKLVSEARVVALANGADAPTLDALKRAGWVDEVIQTPALLPIGEAFSHLMKHALAGGGRYVFHMEDDWDCCNMEGSWWGRSVHCIEAKGVGQVRLRLAHDLQMPSNALTHQTIKWERIDDSIQISRNAHFTFNPSLVSLAVMQGLHPCSSELNAMSKFQGLHLNVARLMPGAFLHTGGEQSLADRVGGR